MYMICIYIYFLMLHLVEFHGCQKMRQISVMLQLWFVVTEPLTVKKWPHRLDMRSFSEGSTCLNLWRWSQLCKSHHHMKVTWTFRKNPPLRWRMFVSEGQYPVMTRHNWMEWFPTKDETLVNLPQTRKLCSRLWVVNVIWLGKRKRVLRLFLKSISAEFGRFNQKLVAKSQVWSLEDPKKSSAQVKISVLTTGFPDFVPDSWSVADLWPLLSFISLLGAIRSCLSFTLWSSNGGWIAGLGSQRTCRAMCTVTPNGAGWVHWKWLV